MKVTLLGVGGSAGTPQIGGADGAGDWGECDPAEPRNRRSRASIVIETDAGKTLLVDTGPDLRTQLTACKIPRIDAVIYTHSHADHIAGLDEIRILNRLLGAPMPTFADEVTWAELRRRFDYAFRPWTGQGFFRPVLSEHLIGPGDVPDVLGQPIAIIGQDHGYITSLGLRIGNFAYSTDVVRLDETALAALRGLDIWVVDCFLKNESHTTHANLAQVLAWVEKLAPRRCILTHMGPSMDYRWLLEHLPPGVEPGFDGMALSL